MEESLARLPFVKPYLSNPEKYGLQGALNFLAFHFNNLSETLHNAPEDASIVTDAAILAQYAYGKDYLKKGEIKTISRLIKQAQRRLPPRDVIIHVHLPLEEHLKRIRQRGREVEKQIPLSFVEGIRSNIQEAVEIFAGNVPVLNLDSSKLDWVNSSHDKEAVLELVQARINKKIIRKVSL